MKHASTSKPSLDTKALRRALALALDEPVPDPDNPATTAEQWQQAVASRNWPDLQQQLVRRRGPGKKPARVAVQLRIPPDVLERWKATGPGWQTRMVERLSAP